VTVTEFGTAAPPGQTVRVEFSTATDKEPGERTTTSTVAVDVGPPSGEKVNVSVYLPGAADPDAEIEKDAGWNDGAGRKTLDGETEIPWGIEVGVTWMVDCGGHEDGATEARTVAAGPPGRRETLAGATEGAKPAAVTFTVKVVCALTPAWSWTRTLTTLGPAVMPAAAETSKETVWIGGSIGTGMDDGMTVSPTGRFGNVTVGLP
jgi:hypothetical protein